MDNKIIQLSLAALLHDIGKFAQRAGVDKSDDMAGEYCPTGVHGKPSHLHVLYTDRFIEDCNSLPLPPDLENIRSQLSRLASSHHKPARDSLEELAISRGDCLSAGSDILREEADTGDYNQARLVSIFDQIRLDGKFIPSDVEKLHYYPLTSIEENSFPTSLAESRMTGYTELYNQFLVKSRNLRTDLGASHYLSSLVSLLERYTWCIPSNTDHSLPDISLFDHAMTTAAIAQALYSYHKECGGMPGEGIETFEKFLLFGGDISGIQKYIFGVDKSHGSGVAKILRARSFQIQAITRTIILSLLQRLGLMPTAKIMDAGGRFILLLPNTEHTKQLLPEFEAELQEWFWKKFNGNLAMSCSYSITLTEHDMTLERFINKLDNFNDHLEQRKLSRYDLMMKNGMSPLAETGSFDFDGDCKVCRQNPADASASKRYREITQKDVSICSSCCEQITVIGTKLPDENNRFLIFNYGDKKENSIHLFGGITMHFAKTITPFDGDALEIVNIRDRTEFAYHAVAGHLPHISTNDMERWKAEGILHDTGSGFQYDGDDVSTGMPKTFQILAGESRCHLAPGKPGDQLRGKSFLGAFKADVDNLGFIFSIGMKGRMSISRFSSLSRMLNHFFADHLVRRIKELYRNIYIVFAGGDDLFLLGPWTEIVEFADMVRKDFKGYTANNPQVTISAGISVIKPALPVHSIAASAEELLEKSKRLVRNGKEKNAVTLFDTTASWEEFGSLKEQGDWLLRLIMEEKITLGLARRLLTYGDDCRAFMRGDIKKGMFLSHISYDFVRNINEKKFNSNRQELDRLKGIKQDTFLLENIRMPLSMALYKLRKN